jgi:transcription-repair coupling factor (superfamily II helicase)
LSIFIETIHKLPEFRQLRTALTQREHPVAVNGLSGVHKAHFIYGLYARKTILVITPDEQNALKLCGDINTMAENEIAKFYPSKEFTVDNAVASREFENMRLSALSTENALIVASVEAVLQQTPDIKNLRKSTVIIDESSVVNTKDFALKLVELGYERADTVEGVGQFSIRGDIIDIFPIGQKAPVRTELWGEEIDSISLFDVETGRRTDKITVFEIPPATENIGKQGYITDYVQSEIVFCEYNDCVNRSKGILDRHFEDFENIPKEKRESFENFYIPLEKFIEKIKRPIVFLSTFLTGKSTFEYKKIINVTCTQFSPWTGDSTQLYEDLSSYLKSGYSVIFVAGNEKTLPTVKADLETAGFTIGKNLVLVTGSLSGGYEYQGIKCAMLTGAKQAESAKRKIKKSKKNGFCSLSELSPGDLIVHQNYGIGRFVSIDKVEVEGLLKDYITIQYAGTDTLQIPVIQLDMISRYIAPRDDGNVKLNKLSGDTWQRTRSNVKKAVRDMAEELIKLYAVREKSEGYAFSPDDDLQKDFEERFPYVETDDQLQCIAEIKEDMQRIRPMDRLLCGDVGFGKTEVALRAAFKCTEDGKQCVILAPTTVLAWQHYKTALHRFEHFPINIEHISRFRTPKQQKEILEKLEKGKIDLIIGTHRLISKDVVFKDLGLAIIDEEQRFGVAQKERFKEIFSGVDVLTLSATPIPRTLNMAMSGIRDMSVIEEAPGNRYPVQTYVMPEDTGIINSAISKELKRGGQVYYIHNRVETISLCAGKLKQFFPDANVVFAHGQMDEAEMNRIWEDMVDGEIDILVCTTIIETGVDVPNVNTLIIENSDRFGLSQLYQLRGRVGRSNRRAYAYLTFKKQKVLSEIAEKRLTAMREFTQFGSGFRIAMRDLEIRGAGSILGGRQHGHMESVGYEMYIKLLNEAVAELKGEIPKKRTSCLIDLKIDAHIPETYIESLNRRLDVYRKIAALQTREDSDDLIDELIDIYGEPPKTIMGLIEISLLRNIAGALGIKEITRQKNQLYFTVTSLTPQQVDNLQRIFPNRITFNGTQMYFSIRFTRGESDIDLLKATITSLAGNSQRLM